MPPQSPYAGTGYNDIYNLILNADPVDWNPANTQTKLDQYGNDFAQQFQNAVGRPPTADEINQFYQQAVAPVANTPSGYYSTDPNAIAQQYIPQAFASQIQDHNKSQIPDLAKQISDLGTSVGQNTANALGDPNNPIYRAFSGGMNNFGITPSSGAFKEGIGATIGNAIAGSESNSLQSLGMGAIGGNQSPTFQNLMSTGAAAGSGTLGYNRELNDFNLQADLARQLNEGGGSNPFQMAMAGVNTAANIGQGVSSFKKPTWICTAMRKSGAMTEDEVQKLHDHLFLAFWKTPFKFLQYLLFGKFLVFLAERRGTDWRVWKPEFYDYVIQEPDPVKAVALYEEAFWSLYRVVRARESRVIA